MPQACTNPNCKAKKCSIYTTENCYWPGGGKEGQFPPNFRQKSRANAALSTHEEAEHFMLLVTVPDAPGISGVILDDFILLAEDSTMAFISKSFQSFQGGKIPTFMDSGASNTMFVSRDTFIDYKPTAPQTGDSAKAEDGNFDIVGEGRVVQHYLVDRKAKNITYTCALHTPTLNANLISVSAFDKAGLTTTFSGGHRIIRKPDGTVVLTAHLDKGLYVVDPIDGAKVMTVPIVMGSLSKSISLEQWHCRFSHCSPSTIEEISKGNLIDGLEISGTDLWGKCEDCVLGHQTCQPFDGMTETKLHPLELVSFNLWGPSRVQSGGGKTYFMPIVDAGTSYKYGAYLSNKSDSSTIAAFDDFRVKAESMTGQ